MRGLKRVNTKDRSIIVAPNRIIPAHSQLLSTAFLPHSTSLRNQGSWLPKVRTPKYGSGAGRSRAAVF